MAGMATQAVRSPSRHLVSCERSPCVGCCASTTAQTRWRRMEVVEVRERQSGTSRQARLAPSPPPVRASAWPPKFAEGARARTGSVKIREGRPITSQRTCMLPRRVVDAYLPHRREGRGRWLLREGEHVG
eukprot:scaffold133354_cov47-Phaeocystis_antarctica.AAC.2